MARDTSSSDVEVSLHYLGPLGTYSHQVAQKLASRLRLGIDYSNGKNDAKEYFEQEAHRLVLHQQPSMTIHATLQDARESATKHLRPSLALLPYENSSNGPVIDSYQILYSERNIRVVTEERLPVSHSLLVARPTYKRLEERSRSGTISFKDLDAVYSHSQALGQCSQFIKEQCSDSVTLVPTSSTGEAARLLAERGCSSHDTVKSPLEACISSSICTQADVYDLVELKSDIQNTSDNVTRFLVIEVSPEEASSASIQARPSAIGQVNGQRALHARALLRLECDDAEYPPKLSTCLERLSTANHAGGPIGNIDITLRKIDRGSQKLSDKNEAENGGAWLSTYLIEVDATFYEASHDAEKKEIDFAAAFARFFEQMKGSVGESIELLGTWLV